MMPKEAILTQKDTVEVLPVSELPVAGSREERARIAAEEPQAR